MIAALVLLGLVWVVIGSILATGTLTELHANRPARQAWRRERLDRFHADALADFLRSSMGVLWVYAVVMALWPVFLWQTRREWRRGGRH